MKRLISIRDVSVAYGGRRVLDGVSLDIYRGEIVALLGGSGSGKTTLLRRVIGLERPDSGSIMIGGVDLTACSEAELAVVRRKIGVAFQESALFSSLTVDENAALPIRELTDARRSDCCADGLDEAEGCRAGRRRKAVSA